MQRAFLSPDKSDRTFQFIINPPSVTGLRNRDSVFWQAPIATDNRVGEFAEVGYFVRWTNGRANLCRFFVNPSETTHYLVDQKPAVDWITNALLTEIAPADSASGYKGLFLENVLALWVEAFNADGSIYNGDSRTSGELPAKARITLIFLDYATAERLAATNEVAPVSALYLSATTPDDFIAQLPDQIKSGVSAETLTVQWRP